MWIGADGRGVRVQPDAQLHVFAHQARQHRPHFGYRAVEIEHARFEHLLAAEGQQLLSQARRALSGLVDRLDPLPQRIVPAQLAQQ